VEEVHDELRRRNGSLCVAEPDKLEGLERLEKLLR
jgi:hypothetical protein